MANYKYTKQNRDSKEYIISQLSDSNQNWIWPLYPFTKYSKEELETMSMAELKYERAICTILQCSSYLNEDIERRELERMKKADFHNYASSYLRKFERKLHNELERGLSDFKSTKIGKTQVRSITKK